MTFSEGQIINGRYRIDRKAGEGDLGDVYRATDERSGSSIVLRPIVLAHSNDAESLADAERQIEVLNEPSIAGPGVLEKAPDGQWFLVRSYVEGVTLEQVIAQQAPFPLSRSCSLALQIAVALEAAHHAGLVHGDLNPANVLVTHDEEAGERVKVLGFGTLSLKKDRFVSLARIAAGVDGQPLCGSPQFLSPEQALGTSPEALDGRSDLYALGVILYQMLAGELPHGGSSPMDVLLAQIFEETKPLAGRTDIEVPLAIDTLLMRMLAKKRGDRPASATAIIDQLGAWEERPSRLRRHLTPTPSAIPQTTPLGEVRPQAPPAAEPMPEMAPTVAMAPPAAARPNAELHLDSFPLSPAREPVTAELEAPSLPEVELPHGTPPHPFPAALTTAARQPAAEDAFVADVVAGSHAASNAPQLGGNQAHPLDIRLEQRGAAVPIDAHKPGAYSATRGSVLFGQVPQKAARSHRVLRGFGIAVLALVILAGAAAGWLYVTGRSYWFDKDFIKTKISYYFTPGAPAGTPTETVDAPAAGAAPTPVNTPSQTAASSHSTAATRPTITPPATGAAPVKTPAPKPSQPTAASHSVAAASPTLAPPGTPEAQNQSQPAKTPVPASQAPLTSKRDEAAGPAPANASTSSTQEDARAESAAVQDAIARGQYYFDRGDYDAAIEVYQRALDRFPGSSELLRRIERARRAKAAEAKYLRQ